MLDYTFKWKVLNLTTIRTAKKCTTALLNLEWSKWCPAACGCGGGAEEEERQLREEGKRNKQGKTEDDAGKEGEEQ